MTFIVPINLSFKPTHYAHLRDARLTDTVQSEILTWVIVFLERIMQFFLGIREYRGLELQYVPYNTLGYSNIEYHLYRGMNTNISIYKLCQTTWELQSTVFLKSLFFGIGDWLFYHVPVPVKESDKPLSISDSDYGAPTVGFVFDAVRLIVPVQRIGNAVVVLCAYVYQSAGLHDRHKRLFPCLFNPFGLNDHVTPFVPYEIFHNRINRHKYKTGWWVNRVLGKDSE